MSERLIRVVMPKTGPVFGIVVKNGVVVEAAPVGRYMIGWTAERAVVYLRGRGCGIDELPTDEDEA